MRSKACAFLTLVLLTGLIWACASTKRTAAAEPEPATLRPPAADPLAEPVVTAEDIQRTPSTSLEQAMSAKFAGVWVSRAPDGGLRIRIRGTSSIMGNQEPLYVVDGVAVNSGPGGNLHGIAPADIATIEVLKDAIATSLYGVRGANGVILIRTKAPPVN